MLGSLLDCFYVAFENRNGEIPKEIQQIQIQGKNSEKWICFLPEGILKFFYTRRILSGRNCDIYVIPKTAIQPNPFLTKDFLEAITEKAINDYSKSQERKINVLGISLGNAPAYVFANNFSVDRFISVVPGSLLPECIWESIATRKIAESSGKTLEDYREALDDFSPIRNLSSLKVNSLEVYLGKSDKMIPYKRCKEIVDEMERMKLNPKTIIFPFSGHCETILYFSRNFAISQ